MDAVNRQSLIDSLVAPHSNAAIARRRYNALTDAELVRAVELNESAARDIARRGRLAALWSDDGSEIVPPDEVESWSRP